MLAYTQLHIGQYVDRYVNYAPVNTWPNYTSRHPVNAVTVNCLWDIGGGLYDIICVSKIQLVVYYQCCILIG